MRRGFGWSKGATVFDEVAEVAVLLLPDRSLEGHGLLGDLDDLADLLGGDHHLLALAHGFRDLFDRRLAPELLQERLGNADQAVDRLDHVDRDPDRAGLVGYGAGYRLADPPGGVRGELVALLVVELLDRADESDVPFLNQIEEGHTAADVLLRDRDDQPQVRGSQLFSCVAADADQLAAAVGQLGVQWD